MTRRHAHAAAGRRAHRAVAATLARDVLGAVEGHGAVGAAADAPTKNTNAAGRAAAPAPVPAASTPSPVTTLVAPLAGADTLLFRRLSGTEEISRLHAWEVEVVSRNPSLDPQALLGRHATVVVRLDDGDSGGPGAHRDETATEASKRYLDGIVTRFGMREGPVEDGRDRGGASGPPLFPYRLILRPWLWLATQQGASGVKVWEGLAVPALLAQVLAPYGHRWSLDRLTRAYRPRPRTVQYRETDFDFIARLCEDEGIHWFFEHEAGAHRLVFVDGVGPGGAYLPVPGGAVVPFLGPSSHGGSSGDRRPQHVDYWTMGHEPALATWRPGTGAPGEAPGTPRDRTRANAHSNKRGLAPGHTLVLQGHPRADQNQAYLVVAVDYHLEEEVGLHSTGPSGHATPSLQRFAMEAHPLALPFQPERQAPRPRVRGPQVGVVVCVVEAAGGNGLLATVRLPAVGEGGRGGEALDGNDSGVVRAATEEADGWLAVLPVARGGDGRMPLRAGDDLLVDFIGGDPEQPVCLCRFPVRSG